MNLGREPEDLECVERGCEGDLLRRLLEVGRDHLDGDGQRARLVALERAVAVQERLRPEIMKLTMQTSRFCAWSRCSKTGEVNLDEF